MSSASVEYVYAPHAESVTLCLFDLSHVHDAGTEDALPVILYPVELHPLPVKRTAGHLKGKGYLFLRRLWQSLTHPLGLL